MACKRTLSGSFKDVDPKKMPNMVLRSRIGHQGLQCLKYRSTML